MMNQNNIKLLSIGKQYLQQSNKISLHIQQQYTKKQINFTHTIQHFSSTQNKKNDSNSTKDQLDINNNNKTQDSIQHSNSDNDFNGKNNEILNQSQGENQFKGLQEAQYTFQAPYKQKQMLTLSKPSFEMLDPIQIYDETLLSENIQINAPWRWTPLIQKQPELAYEKKFQRQMKYFKNLRFFEEEHEKELIDTFLFQALKDSDFDYYYDYQAQGKKWFGNIDYLIYNKKAQNQMPIIPVIRAKRKLNKDIGKYENHFNVYEAIGAGMWAFSIMKAQNPDMKEVQVIMTSGNKWKLIKIGDDGSFEKTGYYFSQTAAYEKIYMEDIEMQSLALGLIKFALGVPEEKEVALKKIYDFVDERRFMTELDSQTKQKFKNQQKYYFWIPKSLRELIFSH